MTRPRQLFPAALASTTPIHQVLSPATPAYIHPFATRKHRFYHARVASSQPLILYTPFLKFLLTPVGVNVQYLINVYDLALALVYCFYACASL